MTTIYAKCSTHCPFSATIEMIERLHRSGAAHTVGPFSSVHTRVRCEVAAVGDYTDRTRVHEALAVRWKAHARIPLPSMRGMITVRPDGPATQVRMEVKYRPLFGVAGRAFDWLAGKRIAQRSIERFLDELKTFVERQWAEERRAIIIAAERHISTPSTRP